MAKCTWPAGCKDEAVKGGKFCDKHRRADQEAQKIKLQKAAAEKEQKERDAKQAAMGKEQEAERERQKAKAEKIKKLAVDWNQKAQTVVTQVKNLRKANPGVKDINAGRNGVGNTAGGRDNPIVLEVPADAKAMGITKADVFHQIGKVDASDSGFFKIRVVDAAGNILVHLK